MPNYLMPSCFDENGNITINVGDDRENYRGIKLNKIDNGLWLGDDRIYDIIQ